MTEQALATIPNPFANAQAVAAPRSGGLTSAAAADVQRSIAEVQAAIFLAKQFPRDRMAAYERIMNECCREGLASVAMYSYSRGGTEITGPSIRLAEALAREWGNIQAGWRELSRNNGVSEVEAWAWDVETNTRFPMTFSVKHWRDTKKGGYQLTDERDIYELLSNNASRRLRACILRVLPGDVVEDAVKQCETTLATRVNVTPERIKNMVEEFGKLGVSKEALEKRVQRRIDTINGPQMLALTKIFNSLRDGMSEPADWFEMEEAEKPKKGIEGVKQGLKQKDATPHNPETGEVVEEASAPAAEPEPAAAAEKPTAEPAVMAEEVDEPRLISVPFVQGDATQLDWEAWVNEMISEIGGAPDLKWLLGLRDKNERLLNNLMKANPDQFNKLNRVYDEINVQLGGKPTLATTKA